MIPFLWICVFDSAVWVTFRIQRVDEAVCRHREVAWLSEIRETFFLWPPDHSSNSSSLVGMVERVVGNLCFVLLHVHTLTSLHLCCCRDHLVHSLHTQVVIHCHRERSPNAEFLSTMTSPSYPYHRITNIFIENAFGVLQVSFTIMPLAIPSNLQRKASTGVTLQTMIKW